MVLLLIKILLVGGSDSEHLLSYFRKSYPDENEIPDNNSYLNISKKRVKIETVAAEEYIKHKKGEKSFFMKFKGVIFFATPSNSDSIKTILDDVNEHPLDPRYPMQYILFYQNQEDETRWSTHEFIAKNRVAMMHFDPEKTETADSMRILVESIEDKVKQAKSDAQRKRRRTSTAIQQEDVGNAPSVAAQPAVPVVQAPNPELTTPPSPRDDRKKRRMSLDVLGRAGQSWERLTIGNKKKQSKSKPSKPNNSSVFSDTEDDTSDTETKSYSSRQTEQDVQHLSLDDILERRQTWEPFLLSFPAFKLTSRTLINQLIEKSKTKEETTKLVTRFIFVWIAKAATPSNLGKETFNAIKDVIEIVKKSSNLDPEGRIMKKWEEYEAYYASCEDAMETDSNSCEPTARENINDQTDLTKFEPGEFAKALTAVHFKLFSEMKLNEILKGESNDAPTVKSFISYNNAFSKWIVTKIVLEEDVKKRGKLFAWFVTVAKKCRKLRNFTGVFEIMQALQQAPTLRLKKTLETLPSKTKAIFSDLENLTSVQKNYSVYRSEFDKVTKVVGASAIPYLAVFMKDLYFIEDGNQSEKNMFNTFKIDCIAKITIRIRRCQEAKYNQSVKEEIRKLLTEKFQFLSEDDAYELSLAREPKERPCSPIEYRQSNATVEEQARSVRKISSSRSQELPTNAAEQIPKTFSEDSIAAKLAEVDENKGFTAPRARSMSFSSLSAVANGSLDELGRYPKEPLSVQPIARPYYSFDDLRNQPRLERSFSIAHIMPQPAASSNKSNFKQELDCQLEQWSEMSPSSFEEMVDELITQAKHDPSFCAQIPESARLRMLTFPKGILSNNPRIAEKMQILFKLTGIELPRKTGNLIEWLCLMEEIGLPATMRGDLLRALPRSQNYQPLRKAVKDVAARKEELTKQLKEMEVLFNRESVDSRERMIITNNILSLAVELMHLEQENIQFVNKCIQWKEDANTKYERFYQTVSAALQNADSDLQEKIRKLSQETGEITGAQEKNSKHLDAKKSISQQITEKEALLQRLLLQVKQVEVEIQNLHNARSEIERMIEEDDEKLKSMKEQKESKIVAELLPAKRMVSKIEQLNTSMELCHSRLKDSLESGNSIKLLKEIVKDAENQKESFSKWISDKIKECGKKRQSLRQKLDEARSVNVDNGTLINITKKNLTIDEIRSSVAGYKEAELKIQKIRQEIEQFIKDFNEFKNLAAAITSNRMDLDELKKISTAIALLNDETSYAIKWART